MAGRSKRHGVYRRVELNLREEMVGALDRLAGTLQTSRKQVILGALMDCYPLFNATAAAMLQADVEDYQRKGQLTLDQIPREDVPQSPDQ